MGTVASQITSLTIVYSTIYSDADQRKHQSSASLAFVRGIHRGPVNSLHKWSVTLKMFFRFDDVIMESCRDGGATTTKLVWDHRQQWERIWGYYYASLRSIFALGGRWYISNSSINVEICKTVDCKMCHYTLFKIDFKCLLTIYIHIYDKPLNLRCWKRNIPRQLCSCIRYVYWTFPCPWGMISTTFISLLKNDKNVNNH